MTSRCERAPATVFCQVAGGVSIEPERKTVKPVFLYGVGAMTSRKLGCVPMVSFACILTVMCGC